MFDFVTGLVVDGYYPVFSALVGFLPTIVLLLTVVSFFENSIFALGFGCTTLAVTNCERDFKTARFLTFIPCSAKLPVFMFMCSVVLGVSLFGVVFLYLLSIFLGLLFGGLGVCRCPRIKRITFRGFVIALVKNVAEFLKRISVGLVLAVTVLYVLNYFDLLLPICRVIEFLFTPIGFNAAMISALVFGLVAKEMVIGVLLTYGVANMGFTAASAVAFLLFVLLYPPCMPCLTALRAKLGVRDAARIALFNFIVAYGVAFVAYNVLVLLP